MMILAADEHPIGGDSWRRSDPAFRGKAPHNLTGIAPHCDDARLIEHALEQERSIGARAVWPSGLSLKSCLTARKSVRIRWHVFQQSRAPFDATIAAATGALLITNPFFLRYLTELRVYSWMMAAAVGGAWAVVLLVAEPTRRRWWVLTGFMVGIGVAMFYLYALWALAVFVVLVATRRLDRGHVDAGVVRPARGCTTVRDHDPDARRVHADAG